MLGAHADRFFAAHARERVIASQPNQFGSSYRVPDRDRLSGLGADPVTSVSVPVPAAAGSWLSSVASFLNPVAAPPANTPGGTVAAAPSKLPLYLALAGGALALFFVLKAK
jgi:hypothetical protein